MKTNTTKKQRKKPSFLARVGGKHQLGKEICEHLDKIPHTCFVDVFCGSGAITLRKEKSKIEVINDKDGRLINLFRVVKHHPGEFVRQINSIPISRSEFQRIKNVLPFAETDIMKGVYYYYLNRNAFGSDFQAAHFTTSKVNPPRLNKETLQGNINQVSKRLDRVTIEELSFEACVKKFDSKETLLYLDPPYFGKENLYDLKTFNPETWKTFEETIKGIQGSWIMSINDVPEIREMFKDFYVKEVESTYSAQKGKNKKVTELLITNQQLPSFQKMILSEL